MHDSHTHLTIEPLKSSVKEHIKKFKEVGGKYILNMSFDIESISDVVKQSMEFGNLFPNLLHTGVGMHPEELSNITHKFLNKEVDRGLELVEDTIQAHKKRIKAVGECGLDYFHLYNRVDFSKEDLDEKIDIQKYSFRKHIEIALKYDLPLSIHTRDANESTLCISDTLKIVSTVGKGIAKGCFHSYTGSKNFLNEILSLGFFVGFNGIITYPKAENVRELLRNTPIERILIETDAPLLPPQNVRNGKSGDIKYGKPADVVEIIETAAREKKMSVEKFIEKTNENYENLFLSN